MKESNFKPMFVCNECDKVLIKGINSMLYFCPGTAIECMDCGSKYKFEITSKIEHSANYLKLLELKDMGMPDILPPEKKKLGQIPYIFLSERERLLELQLEFNKRRMKIMEKIEEKNEVD